MDVLPSFNEHYQNLEYWEARYKSEDTYDWFTSYMAFRKYILQDVKKSDTILMLGCGNSTLSAEMYCDGFEFITNMDYSQIVIDNMAAKHVKMRNMKWVVMDMMQMDLPSNSFDVIIEKGTLDAMLVGEKDPWNMSDEGEATMDCILSQVSDILKPGGRFISVTFAQPHFRKPVYGQTQYDWNLKLKVFGDTFHFFYYIMEKGQVLSKEDKEAEIRYKTRSKEVDTSPIIYLSESEDESFLQNIKI